MTRGFINEIRDLLFPDTGCLICGEDKISQDSPIRICNDCLLSISSGVWCRCAHCGAFVPRNQPICRNCTAQPLCLTRVVAAAPYEGKYRERLHKLKYHGKSAQSRNIGELMAFIWRAEGLANAVDCLVAVPLTAAKKQTRGYNQADLLAQQVGEVLALPVLQAVIQRVQDSGSQTKNSREQRFLAAAHAFAADNAIEQVRGKRVLLIDDVFTTGATLHGAATVLLKNGAAAVYGLTAAGGKQK